MASSRRTGTNENIATYGASGFGRDYTALATWEAATDNDLVTLTTSEVLECYDDAASFNDYVVLESATTNASYFRIIRPASGQGHDGTPNNGVTFICTTDTIIFEVGEQYTQVQDMVAKIDINSANTRGAFVATQADAAFVGCIAFNGINAGAGLANGISLARSSFAIDCLVHNCENEGFILNGAVGNTTQRVYNCTSTNNTYGFSMKGAQATATQVLTNCLGNGNTTDFYSTSSGTKTVTYCASGDATSDDWGGSGNRISQSSNFSFVNSGGDDFHLASDDTGALDYGTDLSSDANYPFDDDIDGDTRSGSWDIGFDEYIPTAGLSIPIAMHHYNQLRA